jgi:hypothetical protein
MPIDPTTPADDSLIASFPANERANRQTTKDLVERDHNGTTGRHQIPRVADAAARDALFTAPTGGNLCYRRDTDTLEIYDDSVPGWVAVVGGLSLASIDDASADATAQDTEVDPGSYTSRSLATSALIELHQVRRHLARRGIGEGVKRAAGTLSAGYLELPPRGQSRIRNGRFYDWDGNAGGGVGNFQKLGASTTFQTQARPAANGPGRELRIVATSAGQGWRHQVATALLRANTIYQLRVVCRVVSGVIQLSTTGGTGAVYGNVARTINSSTEAEYLDLILTDGTPSQIQIDLVSSGGAAEFLTAEVDLRPLSPNPRPDSEFPLIIPPREGVRANSFTASAGAWTVITDLDPAAGIVVPAAGWQILVRAFVCGSPVSGGNSYCGVRLAEQVNGGAWSALNPAAMWSNDPTRPATVSLQRLRSAIALTPGDIYKYRVEARPEGSDWNISPNSATLGGLQSSIIIESSYSG